MKRMQDADRYGIAAVGRVRSWLRARRVMTDRRPWLRGTGTVAVLLTLSTMPAFGQVCGTPPCGGGGAGGGGGKPLTLTWVQDLEFGILAGDGTFAGTATINPVSGAKLVSGAYDFGGIHNPAVFDVRGERNAIYTITLPSSVTLTSGASSMTVTGFTSDPSLVGILPGNGQATLNVGATLQIGAGQPAGVYTGVFTVIANYQ